MINALTDHRSIRKYKPIAISEKVLKEILLAGTRASTTGNMQVYSIVVTTDTKIKEQLFKAHFNQEMVISAPVIVTFCADFNRFDKWCLQRNAEPGYDNFLSFITAAIDALLVAQNVALAAEDKGLGICYLGTTTYNADKIIEILHLPKGVVPVTAFPIGYPDETPELSDRLPLEAVVHYEKYKDYSEEDINNFYSEKENSSFYKKLVKVNNKENLAQIFTDIRYTKKDNEDFSKSLLNVLKKQGFL